MNKIIFEKLDANLAKAIMSIGAVKAVEIVNGEKIERVTGIDLMTGLLEKAPHTPQNFYKKGRADRQELPAFSEPSNYLARRGVMPITE